MDILNALQYGYIECSAKDGRNIEDIFTEIAKLMLQRAGL